MDIWLLLAKALVSLVATATALGGALADLVIPATAKQHMRNPHWPPHAKFHNGQTISLESSWGCSRCGSCGILVVINS